MVIKRLIEEIEDLKITSAPFLLALLAGKLEFLIFVKPTKKLINYPNR